MAIGDEGNLGVRREVVDGEAGEDDVCGIVWQRVQFVGQVAGDDFRSVLPDGRVVLSSFDGGSGDIDAEVSGDVCITKCIGGEPGIAATKIDDF